MKKIRVEKSGRPGWVRFLLADQHGRYWTGGRRSRRRKEAAPYAMFEDAARAYKALEERLWAGRPRRTFHAPVRVVVHGTPDFDVGAAPGLPVRRRRLLLNHDRCGAGPVPGTVAQVEIDWGRTQEEAQVQGGSELAQPVCCLDMAGSGSDGLVYGFRTPARPPAAARPLLAGRAHGVAVAPDGPGALELFKQALYRLAPLYSLVAGMDGLEPYRRMRELPTQVVRIFVIAFPGEVAGEAHGGGVRRIWVRPVDLSVLMPLMKQGANEPNRGDLR